MWQESIDFPTICKEAQSKLIFAAEQWMEISEQDKIDVWINK